MYMYPYMCAEYCELCTSTRMTKVLVHAITTCAWAILNTEWSGPDRTNTLIHGMDRTVEGMVVGVV